VVYFSITTTPLGRDTQRLKNAHNLEEALKQYFSDKQSYPVMPASTDCRPPYNDTPGLANDLVPKYIKSIPQDPDTRPCQYYDIYWSDTHNYLIMANLETIDRGQYDGNWCIAAATGPTPKDWEKYKQCPPLP